MKFSAKYFGLAVGP